MPDTGKPPTALDGDSQMSVRGNNEVMKGNGITNRISLTVVLYPEIGRYARREKIRDVCSPS